MTTTRLTLCLVATLTLASCTLPEDEPDSTTSSVIAEEPTTSSTEAPTPDPTTSTVETAPETTTTLAVE